MKFTITLIFVLFLGSTGNAMASGGVNEFPYYHVETIFYELHDCKSKLGLNGTLQCETETASYAFWDGNKLVTIESSPLGYPEDKYLYVTIQEILLVIPSTRYYLNVRGEAKMAPTTGRFLLSDLTNRQTLLIENIVSRLVANNNLQEPKLDFNDDEWGQS